MICIERPQFAEHPLIGVSLDESLGALDLTHDAVRRQSEGAGDTA